MKWLGTRIAVNHGSFVFKAKLPDLIIDLFIDRARRAFDLTDGISPNQQDKIDENFRQNIEEFVQSDLFTEMQKDVERFGSAAFKKKPRSHIVNDHPVYNL